jgi:outer membrane protein assembly factor BamB
MVRSARPALARSAGTIVLGLLMLATLASIGTGWTASAANTPETNWTVYHHDPAGRGVAAPIKLGHAHRAWVSPALDGQLYGEPLVAGSVVIVATENDTVYALNARTGRVRWSTHVGTPVASASLPCGDITPTLGITSTPVIDMARGEVFVVADETSPRGPVHQLIGLRLTSGAILLRQNVDPPGINTAATLQRVALTLDGGHVVFGYGGNFGDCSTYHGWIVSVPETGGSLGTYEVDASPGEDQGAVWMGGAAPVIDGQGNIWFAVGNGSVDASGRAYDGSDSVIELSASLKLLQYFAPADWASDNAHDRDLGSGTPALLQDGLVVQAGKSQTAYLMSQAKLGGIGGELASSGSFCDGNVDGGNAVVGNVVYMPCLSGIVAVSVTATPPSLHVEWRATGPGGPPIVAGGQVWTISQSGTLYALDRSSGAVVQQFSLEGVANHFPTPSVGDGLLLAPGVDRVYAFANR